MAEARREEEEELRDMRNQNQATGRSERNKPQHFHSSQGPLSSIRAAIKRSISVSQSDHTRDRRRPEITILSAEPLASSAWFPGASGGNPPPSLPTLPIWTGTIQDNAQPPPSYDQVIREKTREHIPTPTAAPRQPRTTTIAIQTDPVDNNASVALRPVCTEASLQIKKDSTDKTCERNADVKKPQKPPRPSLPTSLQHDTTSVTLGRSHIQGSSTKTTSVSTGTTTSAVTPPSQPDSPLTPSTPVSCNTTNKPYVSKSTSAESPPATSKPSVASLEEPVLAERPTPLPRLKSRKQLIPDEVKVQTLVRLKDNGDSTQVTSIVKTDVSSTNKYLQDLLEVFGGDAQCSQCCDVSDQSYGSDRSKDDGMSTLHGQRNIRARIQAFESQASAKEGTEGDAVEKGLEPQRRNSHIKPPPVAAKPALVPKPFIKALGDNGEVSTSCAAKPTLAPRPSMKTPSFDTIPSSISTQTWRPQFPRKPSPDPFPTEEPDITPSKTAVLPPPLPSVAARVRCFLPQGEVAALVPHSPRVETLNLNNHNSTFMSSESRSENHYVDTPSKCTPAKPLRSAGSFSREGDTRRPTTIRVPSRTDSPKLFNESPDVPPPLPVQRPVGSRSSPAADTQSITPSSFTRLHSQNFFSSDGEPSLPPRPTGGKVLPPRPPPAKPGPGRPPPPRLDQSCRPPSTYGSASGASLHKKPQTQAQMPKRNGPILPPRPNPGHRLYNKYTLELPHGIAVFDYNGKNPEELSFQKNEVLLLLDQVDHKTFECQIGDIRGRVQKSHLKVITPLSSFVSTEPKPQESSPVWTPTDISGMQVQALHNFTPEGPGELALRAGDVVTTVEQLDSQWYRGTCRGSSGFFPVNYVQILQSNPSPPTNGQKAKPPVSGPRCVARFDFEGETSDELAFSEGDVIQLQEYMGDEWARGQKGGHTGIFPVNFVEVIEDLPCPQWPQQQSLPTKIALPGMTTSVRTNEAANPIQPSSFPGMQWAVALYDFVGQTDEDLSIQEGDHILVLQHVDADWCSGRLNHREGLFPRAFVEISSSDQSPAMDRPKGSCSRGGKAKALFDFQSDCDEELSIQVGDIIKNLESVDEEWFLGDLRGKRALVPKNYVRVLVEP